MSVDDGAEHPEIHDHDVEPAWDGELFIRPADRQGVYMPDLYKRAGLDEDSTADEVLSAVRARWENPDDDFTMRVEAAELFLGRRIDGSEVHDLHPALMYITRNGALFDDFVAIMNEISQADGPNRPDAAETFLPRD